MSLGRRLQEGHAPRHAGLQLFNDPVSILLSSGQSLCKLLLAGCEFSKAADDLFHFSLERERAVLLGETQRQLEKPGVNSLCLNSPVMPAFSTRCHGLNESTDSEMLEVPQRVIY